MGGKSFLLFSCTALGINDIEYCIVLFEGLQRSLLQALVQRFFTEVETRCIGEDQLAPLVGIDTPDRIPGCLRGTGGNGDLHLTNRIEQGALSS